LHRWPNAHWITDRSEALLFWQDDIDLRQFGSGLLAVKLSIQQQARKSAETAARTRLGWWRRKNKERQESLDNHGAISAMRALYRYVKRVFNLDREDHHWESASWRGIGDRV